MKWFKITHLLILQWTWAKFAPIILGNGDNTKKVGAGGAPWSGLSMGMVSVGTTQRLNLIMEIDNSTNWSVLHWTNILIYHPWLQNIRRHDAICQLLQLRFLLVSHTPCIYWYEPLLSFVIIIHSTWIIGANLAYYHTKPLHQIMWANDNKQSSVMGVYA